MSDDFLGMSDEDFINAPVPELTSEEVAEEESHVDSSDVSEEAQEESFDEDDVTDEEVEESSEEASEEDSEEELEEELDSEENSDNTSVDTSSSSDQETELKKILEPFKANGGEVQVKSVDEAIQLMQMGANYTKKMQALQPNLKVLKMLEHQDLLDEGKLNYLIDLSKKDPKAIAKLVQESGIDPLSLEPEEGSEYEPTNYSVPNEAVQLDQVLSEIENTPTYSKCIDVVGNQWDDSSKQLLSQNPQMIKQLNEQMQMGIFDQINKEVERLKMFGGLSGLSDFEAYKEVGTKLYQAGELQGSKPQPVAKTEPSKPKDTARSQKRKAASSPKSSKKVAKKEDFNPLAMSDEEFEKIVNQRLK
jgi:hypothetical protein